MATAFGYRLQPLLHRLELSNWAVCDETDQPRAAARFKVHRPALTRPSADIVATAAD